MCVCRRARALVNPTGNDVRCVSVWHDPARGDKDEAALQRRRKALAYAYAAEFREPLPNENRQRVMPTPPPADKRAGYRVYVKHMSGQIQEYYVDVSTATVFKAYEAIAFDASIHESAFNLIYGGKILDRLLWTDGVLHSNSAMFANIVPDGGTVHLVANYKGC